MHRIETLQSVASRAGLSEAAQRLSALERAASGAAPIVVPLVGEFSAGKTSLLNSLMDSGVLETAVTPTTAAIFEVHFGAPQSGGCVTAHDGSMREVEDMGALRNEDVEAAAVVQVYDTSTKVPPTVVLVDTPGLSSPKPQHRQTLIDFLPAADAIMLVADVNQQVTSALTDFVQTAQLSGRPLFLVLTKTDCKSPVAVQQARDYAARNTSLGVEKVVCVSAAKGEVGELLALLGELSDRKSELLQRVATARAEVIGQEMRGTIEAMLGSLNDSSELQRTLEAGGREIERGKEQLKRLLEGLKMDIDQATELAICGLAQHLQQQLAAIAQMPRESTDEAAIQAINHARSLFLSRFVAQVRQLFAAKVAEWRRRESNVDEAKLDTESLNAQISLDNGYHLGLANAGHEYDSTIANCIEWGVSAVMMGVAVGKAALTAAGKVAGEVALKEAGKEVVKETGKEALKEAGKEAAKKIAKRLEMVECVGAKLQGLLSQGLLTSAVSKVSEMAGPSARKAAALRFLETYVVPDYKEELHQAADRVKREVQERLLDELDRVATERQAALTELREKLRSQRTNVAEQRRNLKECLEMIRNVAND